MKLSKIRIAFIILSISLICFSCGSDDDKFPSQGLLDDAIAKAKTLIETTTEGVEEGNYAPGSQKDLQARIDWAYYIMKTSGTDEARVNAAKQLEQNIELFKTNIVKKGFPVYDAQSYFNLGKFSDYNIYDKFTIECKVRFKDFGSGMGNIIAAEAPGEGVIIRYQGEKLEAYINNGGWLGGGANRMIELNKWYHLAFTFSGKQVRLYIDGVLVMEQTASTTGKVKLGDQINLHAGANPSYPARVMRGNIAQVSIWNYARSESQIQSDLDPAFVGTEEGLLAYWPFNMNLGSTIEDRTGKFTALGTSIVWEDQ